MAVIGVSVEEFFRKGCDCKFGPNNSSSLEVFDRLEFVECKENFLELSNEERDMFLLSFFTMNRVPNKPVDKKSVPIYRIYGYNVCKRTFMFLTNIGGTKYQNIADHYNVNGLSARRHGNKGRLPSNTSSFGTVEHVKSFIQAYANDNAMPLPGRVPGHNDQTQMVLSSSVTKRQVWELYCSACIEAAIKPVGHSLFLDLWNSLLPWIAISKPSSDLCWTCQKLSQSFSDPCLTDDEKESLVDRYKSHLNDAKKNRLHYKEKTEEAIVSLNLRPGPKFDPFTPTPACTFDGVAHYSWDYAQQLHYPTDPQQPGPIYFKTPRKCGLFGIVNEGTGVQFNYLIDEAVSGGKGANNTISLVHHYLQNHGMGEKKAYFHADNCSGLKYFFVLTTYTSYLKFEACPNPI